MKKCALKCVSAILATATFGTGVLAEVPYTVTHDFENNKITISGEGLEGEKVIFQILNKNVKFEDWTPGANPMDFVLWHGQVTVGEDETFTFEVPYSEALNAGLYNSRTVSDISGISETQSVELVGTQIYSDALSGMIEAAKEKDYEAFKVFIGGGDGIVSPVGFELEIFNRIDNLESYAEYVAKDGASDFAEEKHFDKNAMENRSKYFNTFMIIEGLKEDGIITNMKTALEESSVPDDEKKLWKDLSDCITDETEWKYLRNKLESKADDIVSPDSLTQALIEAFVLTETKYADGNDIKNVLVTLGYADEIGISNPTSKSKVYSAMNGKDYSDIDDFLYDYEKYEDKYSESSSGGGGGGGSSSGKGGSTATVPSYTGTISQTENTPQQPELVDVPFVDIEGVSWAAESIIALAHKGIINGKGNGYFEPDEHVTREEFVKIIVCAAGYENDTYSGNKFTDVNDSDWFCKYVNIAYEKGLVNGLGNGEFGTGNLITRQDMTVILCNALKAKGAELPTGALSFDDMGSISGYALSSVEALYAMGVVNGISEKEFQPLGYATRAQAAKIIYGVLEQLK